MNSELIEETSPRERNLEKMNVMNFISKNYNNERFGSTDSEQKENQKINRNGSKKMIHGLMQYQQNASA